MRIKEFSLWPAVAVLSLLASLTCANRAHAQVTTGNDLNLGSTYNTFGWSLYSSGSLLAANEGGGSISPSFLNGAKLPWVYCVDITDNVGVPANYNNTTVTTNGTVTVGSANPGGGGTVAGGYIVGNSATVAGQIAYVLDTYANQAATPLQQEAVQAAIWTLIYGAYNSTTHSGFQVTDSTVASATSAILTAANGQIAALNSVFWLSPNGNGQNGAAGPGLEQALVTAAVPEPSTFAIASLCGAGFIFYGLRRRKAMGG